jgi:hypothetical protein
MATKFRIPRLTDRELVRAVGKVRLALLPIFPLKMRIETQHLPTIELEVDEPENDSQLADRLAAEAETISAVSLLFQGRWQALVVVRDWEKPDDSVTITDDWITKGGDEAQRVLPKLLPGLIGLGRRELKANELDAALSGDADAEWNRYRRSQMKVLSSLQQATQAVLFDAATRNSKLDQARAAKYEALEEQLRAATEEKRWKLQQQHEHRLEELERREKEQADKEAEFQTKEARYVSRQKQDDQIKQIQAWLENWGLTKGTSRKRWPITGAYVVALLVTGGLTTYATSHNYELIKTTEELAKLQWWHWLALASKAFFPLAAFSTFMVYFIRWSSSWAKQHSEEEFRNRSRLIDIGRSGWLLEAVRDAHEKNAEIPTDLLRELSRNLFSNASSSESDIHPSALSDVMLQGLTSLRVKTADGSEVEASRSKSKK